MGRGRLAYRLRPGVTGKFELALATRPCVPSARVAGLALVALDERSKRSKALGEVRAVNVGFDTYKIRTQITDPGSTVDAGYYVDRRDRLTRRVRWEQLEEDLAYAPNQLDRDVVPEDQIRTVTQTFRDRLFTEIFPSRRDVPKTIIFAKDDSHADDIVCADSFSLPILTFAEEGRR